MPKDLPACSANQLSDCANSRGTARIIALTARHNDFKAEVGMTPKLFSRVQRFQRTRTLIEHMGSSEWVDIAMECGYFDQSHLIREFHELSGISPGLISVSTTASSNSTST